jgi:RNA polymerase sigma-70 factor (ECF subfamily)
MDQWIPAFAGNAVVMCLDLVGNRSGASETHHLRRGAGPVVYKTSCASPADSRIAKKLQHFTAARLAIHHDVTSGRHMLLPSSSLASLPSRGEPEEARRQQRGFPMSDFARLLEVEIPRLRRYARALTRDVTRADDLVQSCLTRAVAKQHLWHGTDLRAWLFTILHNQHVNDVRRSVREGIGVAVEEMAPLLTVQSSAIAALQLRDLEKAIAKLPQEQRQVILLVGLEGMRYEEVALILKVPVGTVLSRLSRGRDQLRRLMDMGDEVSPRPPAAIEPDHRALGRRRAAA